MSEGKKTTESTAAGGNKFREALEYHAKGRPGKIAIVPTKPTATQNDLSLAYSPGVAGPCLEIAKNIDAVFQYTNRGNLVAVVTNGSAVLGLGDIGPEASKPVMEGKAVLFKRFADIDVFDIELKAKSADDIIRACEMLEPTFGGINLEDISAPDSFIVEEALQSSMGIPVFHDDQHGTAIIAGAGLLNACEISGKNLKEVRVVVNGAGAAGIATAKFLLTLGVNPANVLMCDSLGVIHSDREKLTKYKQQFARTTTRRTLKEALDGADVFVGVSVAGAVDPEMLKGMADRPVVFALANPDPEIPYPEAKLARPDAIVATGRTDFPNQVNNVLGFPYIFRGALDVRARSVTESMKVAAARAIAALAKEPVPDAVLRAYQVDQLGFGPEYIIPKPFDPRVVWHVAPAVAEAAMADGVARQPLASVEDYRNELRARFETSYGVMRSIHVKAQQEPKRLIFPQGCDQRVLRAARHLVVERMARPVILGDVAETRRALEEAGIPSDGMAFVDPSVRDERRAAYASTVFEARGRKGLAASDADAALDDPHMYAAVALHHGHADALLGGLTTYYPTTLRPALQVLPLQTGRTVVCGVYILTVAGRTFFLADCAVNAEPTAEQLAEIALATVGRARVFDITPHVAFLSYSNYGSAKGAEVERVRRAVSLCKRADPNLSVDGEMHADTAVNPELLHSRHPFSTLRSAANVLIFPNLSAANSCYKLLHRLGRAAVIGPILSGMAHSVHVAPREAEVGDLVNLAAIAVLDAQRKNDQQPHLTRAL